MNRRAFFGASFAATAVAANRFNKESMLWTPGKEIEVVPEGAVEAYVYENLLFPGMPNSVSMTMLDGTQITVPFHKLHEIKLHWSPSMAEVQMITEAPRTRDVRSAFNPLVRHIVMQDQEFEIKVTPRHDEENTPR